jgi:hypothetical protein
MQKLFTPIIGKQLYSEQVGIPEVGDSFIYPDNIGNLKNKDSDSIIHTYIGVTDIIVAPTGNNVISDAIQAASSGDTIRVLPGVYNESSSWYKDGVITIFDRGVTVNVGDTLLYIDTHSGESQYFYGYADFVLNNNIIVISEIDLDEFHFECNSITG